MRIFFVGDFKSHTGPGIANKLIQKALSDTNSIVFSSANNSVMRVFEVIINVIKCERVCICSFSKMNYIVIKLANLFRKDVYYIMHGYLSYEESINNTNDKKNNRLIKLENFIIRNSQKVVCVSKKFMEFMIQNEPVYSSKFDYNYNGIDIKEIIKEISAYKNKKQKNQITSIGGGMRQKNNLVICKAIEMLNFKYDLDLKYIVIGLPYTDKYEICQYNFVQYYDYLPHDEVLQILAESNLYIQNSTFETFGLAIVEALLSDCNLLITNNIGVIDLINDIEESDVINNPNDVNEIAKKIEKVLLNNNSCRLKNSLQLESIDYQVSVESLMRKLKD